MSDWIHCNKCFVRYDPNMKISLTECGHLLCENCAKNLRETCIICTKPTKAVTLNKNVDSNVQQFFLPFDSFIKKITEVYNFQMQHRTRLFQMIVQKYNYAKRECLSAMGKNKALQTENKRLKMILLSENGDGKRPLSTSTPFGKSDVSQADMSAISSVGFTPSFQRRPVPGVAHRILLSGNNILRRPPSLQRPTNSGGSSNQQRSLTRELVSQMERNLNVAPVHRAPGPAFSMEQLRRAAGRPT